MLTDIMDELLNLGLHAPVAELNLAQLIGTHERSRLGCRPRPVISQWPSACFDRAVEPRVLFCFVLSGGHGIPHDVDGIWRGFSPALSKPSPCSDLCPSHPKRLGGKPLTDRNMRLRTGACWWLPTKVTAGAPQQGLTQDSLPSLSPTQVEDIRLLSTIRQVVGLYLNGEFLHKGAGVPGRGQ